MSNYTGPITIVNFIGPRDAFAFTFHDNVDDTDQVEKICRRFAEDGYKPDDKTIRKEYMVNGSIVRPEERQWGGIGGPAGYSRRSAFLRA